MAELLREKERRWTPLHLRPLLRVPRILLLLLLLIFRVHLLLLLLLLLRRRRCWLYHGIRWGRKCCWEPQLRLILLEGAHPLHWLRRRGTPLHLLQRLRLRLLLLLRVPLLIPLLLLRVLLLLPFLFLQHIIQ